MATRVLLPVITALLLFAPVVSVAQDEPAVTLESLQKMLLDQQKMLEEQRRLIESQGAELQSHREALKSMGQQFDELRASGGTVAPAEPAESVELRERLAAVEAEMQNQPDEPEDMSIEGEFPGSIRIPGTNMAGKVGGFVRLGVVNSLDPIGSDDRFIVGSIPVGEVDPTSEENKGVTISAKRSRLNLDMRMDSSVGQFRAFVEGDFATEVDNADVYRLRHAFGQYKNFVLGQTWSTFMDRRSEPEELDFEGLNASIIDRRPIVRWSREKPGKPSFAIAFEDPSAEITGGTAAGDVPDLVARLGRTKSWGHIQVAFVARLLAGQPDGTPEVSDSTFGWGVSVSGNNRFPFWSKKDNFKYQLNFGKGIGKYVNDMDSVGGLDAVFDPKGKLRALPAFAGYVAYQHYWKKEPLAIFGAKDLLKNLRTTLVYGFTQVDDFDFQAGDSYRRTRRVTANLIWSPLTAIDLGFEFLWGERLNLDENRGTARQFQLVASFYF